MRRIILICVGFALLACLDLGIPLWVLAGRAAILRNGTEVKLELATRDPRDLFRGEYSVLAYAIGNLRDVPATDEERARCASSSGPDDCNAQSGQPLFVMLVPGDNGTSRAAHVALREPAPGTLFIRGKLRFGGFQIRPDPAKCPSGRCFNGGIDYGIETWFGPQGVPAQVDRAARNQLTAVVRIDAHGNAVLADLLIDGKPVGR
jgi:uncharacterized membrane-anchored protein